MRWCITEVNHEEPGDKFDTLFAYHFVNTDLGVKILFDKKGETE